MTVFKFVITKCHLVTLKTEWVGYVGSSLWTQHSKLAPPAKLNETRSSRPLTVFLSSVPPAALTPCTPYFIFIKQTTFHTCPGKQQLCFLLYDHNQDSILTQVVPDVHFSTQRSNFNYTLAQEIIRFPLETLLHPWLDIIILIPHTYFNSVWGIVALTREKWKKKITKNIDLSIIQEAFS